MMPQYDARETLSCRSAACIQIDHSQGSDNAGSSFRLRRV